MRSTSRVVIPGSARRLSSATMPATIRPASRIISISRGDFSVIVWSGAVLSFTGHRGQKNGEGHPSPTDYSTRGNGMAFVIGLTGNIACGKSTVGSILRGLGAEYVDADAIVHALLAAGTDTAARVVERFGPHIANPDGAIDRRALGAIVFRSPTLLAELERLLHPAVREEIRRRM